jgi:hypothetical protein
MKIRIELENSGLASPHHMLPHSRWISYWVHKDKEDIQAVIELFRIRYEYIKPTSSNQARREKTDGSNLILIV